MATVEQAKAATQLIIALADAIKEAGDQGAPLGPMYVAFNAGGMSYHSFMRLIQLIVDTGRVRVSNHVAYWVQS